MIPSVTLIWWSLDYITSLRLLDPFESTHVHYRSDACVYSIEDRIFLLLVCIHRKIGHLFDTRNVSADSSWHSHCEHNHNVLKNFIFLFSALVWMPWKLLPWWEYTMSGIAHTSKIIDKTRLVFRNGNLQLTVEFVDKF